mgnify:CR=1 FL=1
MYVNEEKIEWVAYNNFGYDVQLTQTRRALRIVDDGGTISYDTVMSPTILYYGRFRNGYLYRIEGDFGWEYVPMDIQRCAFPLIISLIPFLTYYKSPKKIKY